MFSEDDGMQREFFEQLPFGASNEDYSAVKRQLDQLLAEDIGDLRSYLSKNSDVLFGLGNSITHLEVNDSLLKLFRVESAQEYLDLANNSELWKKGEWAEFYAQQFASLIDGKSQPVNYLDIAADGTLINFNVTAWIPPGREDDWSLVISTHQDLTEVRGSKSLDSVQGSTEKSQTEERQREFQLLYRKAERLGNIGFWEWDSVNEKMISCSEQYASIFGMSVEEALAYFTSQENDVQVVHPDDRDRYRAHDRVLGDPLSGADIEYRLIRPSGEIRHVHEQSEVVLDNQGKAVRFFGTIQDITERVQAEENLRHSHALYSQAEKVGKLGHWEWDHADYKMTACSEQFAEIYEMGVDEAISFFSGQEREVYVVHPDDRDRYEQHAIDTEQQRKGMNIEYRIITAKGNLRHINLRSRLVTDDENRVIRSFGTSQDISDRIKLETERNRLADQLLQGQKMESLGVLAGGIAHDFNNILATVLGYASLAQEEARGSESLSEYLQKIVKSGERGRNLTQQILSFSRKTEVESHPMDVISVIREVVDLLQSTLPPNTVFEQYLDANCGTIVANQTVVHQLLMNLCTNAAQAMEPNGGTVTILAGTAQQTELPAELDPLAADGWLRIGIADTGMGIPEEIRHIIFDPFFTTKEIGRGTGMGLAAVHGIVKNLGGHIQVTSEENNGALFEVFLPTTIDPITLPAPDGQKTLVGNANILFIDDERSLVDLAKIQLERLGYTVSGFSSADEALVAAAADPGGYDILVTDFSMPGMSGLNAARKFTEINPGLPVLMITGLDPDISDAELVAAGICRTMPKPCSTADLSRAISESLS